MGGREPGNIREEKLSTSAALVWRYNQIAERNHVYKWHFVHSAINCQLKNELVSVDYTSKIDEKQFRMCGRGTSSESPRSKFAVISCRTDLLTILCNSEFTRKVRHGTQYNYRCLKDDDASEVDSFSHGCYQALSSPRLWGESLGTRLGLQSAKDGIVKNWQGCLSSPLLRHMEHLGTQGQEWWLTSTLDPIKYTLAAAYQLEISAKMNIIHNMCIATTYLCHNYPWCTTQLNCHTRIPGRRQAYKSDWLSKQQLTIILRCVGTLESLSRGRRVTSWDIRGWIFKTSVLLFRISQWCWTIIFPAAECTESSLWWRILHNSGEL